MTNKLLKFGRPSCVPCKMVEQYLEEQEVKYQDYNVEEDLMETAKYGVSGVPTLILIDADGNTIDRFVGFNPPAIDELIEKL